jgi:hypothetical protein
MKSYNGFSPAQRMKALKWSRARRAAAGEPAAPSICDSCGQTHPPLTYHSEDYSEPFGPHIGQYALCYICHMMIHCRFRNPARWRTYKEAIRKGVIYDSYGTNNWQQFRNDFLMSNAFPNTYSLGEPKLNCLLDEIDGTNVE